MHPVSLAVLAALKITSKLSRAQRVNDFELRILFSVALFRFASIPEKLRANLLSPVKGVRFFVDLVWGRN